MAVLERLALWAQCWSPWTAVDGADGMLIDIGGCAHLFGGERAMLRVMTNGLATMGYRARAACAPTIGAAWALSHCGGEAMIVATPETLHERLDPLPVRGLRLEPGAVLLLGRLGLKTIGSLRAVPRQSLARRFAAETVAANPLIRLDQATGRIDELVVPEVRDAPVRVVRRVTDPITHVVVLEHLLVEMVGTLCGLLERRGLGVRRTRLDAFRVDGGIQTAAAETSAAMRDPRHIVRLFDGRLEALDAGFGFDAVVLTAERHEQLDADQAHLLDAESDDALLGRLIDRLGAKLGPDCVRRPLCLQSHVPERSLSWRPASASAIDTGARPPRVRPLRLFDRPEPIGMPSVADDGAPRIFVWRKLMHRIAKFEGPERIAPEWWRERSTVRLRDYYRVEDDAGRRYWLFCEGAAGDGRGEEPAWFLHGLFA